MGCGKGFTMPESHDAHTVTAGAASLDEAEVAVPLLRWVTSRPNLVTILANLPALLGRDPDATTRLTTAQVSRRHAVVELASGEPTVRDLDSKNGVFVNGRRVSTSPLKDGDVLRLGDACAVVETVLPDGIAGFGELAPGIFGGARLRSVMKRLKLATAATLNVVLLGETGTGKEGFARAIHRFSGRSGAFVAVNCAAYTESTVLAELFGYRKGAFTGAERPSLGHVRAAHQGTLLLDEILDLSLDLQAKLLRVIEEREVMPLGETEPVPVDVKLVSATQMPLGTAVASGLFRADLRARLEGIVIEIPPLRARRADVLPLFFELLARHGVDCESELVPELEPELVERLCLHDWPMNVRELENVARRIVALYAERRSIKLADVVPWLGADDERHEQNAIGSRSSRERRSAAPYSPAELEALHAALERHGGNLTKAAAELGITRPKAYRMLESKKSGR
jgi:transcriptional regulator with AAA-type ATPase domain